MIICKILVLKTHNTQVLSYSGLLELLEGRQVYVRSVDSMY